MVDLDVVEAKTQEAPMIYKGIERLCGDPNPLWRKEEDYGSVVSTYLSLKKATSLFCHPIVTGQQKAQCTEQVELAKSRLTMVHEDLDPL